MCDIEKGDKVRVLASMNHDGEEGIIEYTFDDYGTPSVCVKFEDGGSVELMEESVEYIGLDKYEYAVQSVVRSTGRGFEPEGDDWMDKEDAENVFLETLETNFQYEKTHGPLQCSYRLVKRRKAGRVEPV